MRPLVEEEESEDEEEVLARVQAAFDMSLPLVEDEEKEEKVEDGIVDEDDIENQTTPRVDLAKLAAHQASKRRLASPNVPDYLLEDVASLPAMAMAFYKAVSRGDTKTLLGHVEAGVQIDAFVSGETAMHAAVRARQMGSLRILIGHNAKVIYCDPSPQELKISLLLHKCKR